MPFLLEIPKVSKSVKDYVQENYKKATEKDLKKISDAKGEQREIQKKTLEKERKRSSGL